MLSFFCLILVACSYANVAFVWQANDVHGDHVAQVDVRPFSRTFGQVLSRTFLPPYPSIAQTGNEPHHIGVSGDRRFLVTAGLGSFLQGKDQVFVWNLDPSNLFRPPTFAYSLNVPGFGCPDEFVPFGRQQLLLTMMCNSQGSAPGAIFKLDLSTKSISLWTRGTVGGQETYNPHGVDSSKWYGVIAADYINPISLFSPPPFTFRDTLHHFWPNGSYAGLINLPTTNGGFMDFRFTDRWGQTRYGITSSSTTNVLYRIDALNHADVRPLLDLSKVVGGAPVNSGGIMRFSRSGTRFIMTFQFRYVLLIEFTPDLSRANVIQVFDFCKNVDPARSRINFPQVCANTGNTPGSHYIVFSPLEDRFIVTNYFIRIGNVQTVQSGMHLFKVSYFSGWSLKDLFQIKSFSYEYAFQPDLSINGDQSYPHGVAYLRGWHTSPDDDDDGIGN